LEIAFEPIKLQLKRDLKKYESIVDRNKKNGLKGGRPHKTQINPKNPVGYLETKENPKKPKKADTDNDTDNVIVKDILNIDSHNEIFRKLWNSDQWIESLCIKWNCEVKEVKNHLNEFRQECIVKDQLKVDDKDAKSHFVNWVKKGNPVKTEKPQIIVLESKRINRNPE
jgi:hypothetical protein